MKYFISYPFVAALSYTCIGCSFDYHRISLSLTGATSNRPSSPAPVLHWPASNGGARQLIQERATYPRSVIHGRPSASSSDRCGPRRDTLRGNPQALFTLAAIQFCDQSHPRLQSRASGTGPEVHRVSEGRHLQGKLGARGALSRSSLDTHGSAAARCLKPLPAMI